MLNIATAIETSVHATLDQSRNRVHERFARYITPHLQAICQLYVARDECPPNSRQHATYEDLIRQQARVLIGDQAFNRHMEFDLTDELGAYGCDLASSVGWLENFLVDDISALASGFYRNEQESLNAYCCHAFSWWQLLEEHGMDAMAQASRASIEAVAAGE